MCFMTILYSGWQQLKDGDFYVRAVFSGMDRITLYHVTDSVEDDIATLPDRVLTHEEFLELIYSFRSQLYAGRHHRHHPSYQLGWFKMAFNRPPTDY